MHVIADHSCSLAAQLLTHFGHSFSFCTSIVPDEMHIAPPTPPSTALDGTHVQPLQLYSFLDAWLGFQAGTEIALETQAPHELAT